ncbi:MAG: G8 domain-containing protein [Isosphaeraceae bacterium]
MPRRWKGSRTDGPWSAPETWEAAARPLGRRPGAGPARGTWCPGHPSRDPAPSVHVAGTLRFDPDRDTLLTAGLIKVQPGDDPGEAGVDRDDAGARPHGMSADGPRPALEVGTAAKPIPPGHSAVIRLALVPGLDPAFFPALVCDGGRMDLHGAPLSHSWVKLGQPAKPGDTTVTLAGPVSGWRPGDRVIVTSTRIQHVLNDARVEPVGVHSETEERRVRSVEGNRLTLDAPLNFPHDGQGDFRGEVALLSRNVVVESADASSLGDRGHTMVHAGSAGSISHVEFRNLGKPGKLGRYALHFHRAGDTMRGTSVVGASFVQSGNRWVTIHGTNRLLVRDCIGYGSVGHGFFFEDGTEVDNLLIGNLAVQARGGRPLPGQVLPFDENAGAGFWWANCRNALVRNVAVECEEYGFRFDMSASGFDPVLNVRDGDGKRRPVDVRTVPFLRFEGNEAHTQRHHGFNLGGAPHSAARPGVEGVGPDDRHPFAIRNLRVWESRWGFTPAAPCVLVDGCDLSRCEFAFWRPVYDRHAYQGVRMSRNRWPYFEEEGQRQEGQPFPAPLRPVDDRPPVTLITRVEPLGGGRVLVAGVSADDGAVQVVRVNGRELRPTAEAGLAEWRVELEGLSPGPYPVTALTEDAAGHREVTPHRLTVEIP